MMQKTIFFQFNITRRQQLPVCSLSQNTRKNILSQDFENHQKKHLVHYLCSFPYPGIRAISRSNKKYSVVFKVFVQAENTQLVKQGFKDGNHFTISLIFFPAQNFILNTLAVVCRNNFPLQIGFRLGTFLSKVVDFSLNGVGNQVFSPLTQIQQ